MIRERDVLDGALLVMLDHGLGHVLERLGSAGAAVEDAGVLRVLPEPEVNLADIVHIDEITHLATIRETVTALEQLGIVTLLHLGIEVESHRGHGTLVLLARTVDVEVLQTHDLGVDLRQPAAHVLVEQLLGVAIDVERLLELGIFDEVVVAATVGRGGGGVDKRDFPLDTVVEQILGVLVVYLHDELAIPLSGGGAGTFMEDHLDAVIPLFKLVTGDDPRLELVLIHVIGNGQVDQIDELGAVGQVIDDHDIGPSLSVQLLDQIAADKASTASYYDHGVCLAYVDGHM